MKYAVISDIHANLEALDAVIASCKKMDVDKYLCIGDIVGYNANPAECVESVRNLPLAGVVMGNHDEQASKAGSPNGFHLAAALSMKWTRMMLTVEQRRWLGNLNFVEHIDGITIVHSSLDAPQKWKYVFDRRTAQASFDHQMSQVCFMGHSHVPVVFEKNGIVRGSSYKDVQIRDDYQYLINVGSVGQPRDGNWLASFAIYDTESRVVRLHRVPYDVKTAQSKILVAGLPGRNAFRLQNGK